MPEILQGPPEPNLPNPLTVYTAVELAARLGVNPKTLYEGCRSGTVPHLRLGRRYVFPRQAIDKWLDAVGELSPEPVQKPPRRTRSTKRC